MAVRTAGRPGTLKTEMKKDITSEEKLLHLIRKKMDTGGSDVKGAAASSIAARRSFVVDRRKGGERRKPRWEVVDFLNGAFRVFVGVAVVLSGYIGYNFFIFKDRDVVEPLEAAQENGTGGVTDDLTLSEGEPFSAYAEIFQERDIFGGVSMKGRPQVTAGPSETVPSAVDVAQEFKQNFKLVGIVLDQDPKAVIEDLKNQQTLFLSRGEKIGEGELTDIQAGKIVLQIRGQTIELTP